MSDSDGPRRALVVLHCRSSDARYGPEQSLDQVFPALRAEAVDPRVLALYRRAVRKNAFYPSYRHAREAIDALAVIATDEALTALEEIGRTRAPWKTKRFREMRQHVLQAIARIPGTRARDVLRRHLNSEDRETRAEAKRLLRNLEP